MQFTIVKRVTDQYLDPAYTIAIGDDAKILYSDNNIVIKYNQEKKLFIVKYANVYKSYNHYDFIFIFLTYLVIHKENEMELIGNIFINTFDILRNDYTLTKSLNIYTKVVEYYQVNCINIDKIQLITEQIKIIIDRQISNIENNYIKEYTIYLSVNEFLKKINRLREQYDLLVIDKCDIDRYNVDKCYRCKYSIRNKQYYLRCKNCNQIFHINCILLSMGHYCNEALL